MLSVHTSPLAQPGIGDAGGMNVYVLEVAKRLAASGVAVEIFTRATSSDQPPVEHVSEGLFVRNVLAGPFQQLHKEDLPAQLCGVTALCSARSQSRSAGSTCTLLQLSGQVGWVTTSVGTHRWSTVSTRWRR
jgi:D-inositol-3-phosphate glycosyltransferase